MNFPDLIPSSIMSDVISGSYKLKPIPRYYKVDTEFSVEVSGKEVSDILRRRFPNLSEDRAREYIRYMATGEGGEPEDLDYYREDIGRIYAAIFEREFYRTQCEAMERLVFGHVACDAGLCASSGHRTKGRPMKK